jgi:hypothetical protein
MTLARPYKIILPNIPSAGVYYFVTDRGTKYEVRFGRKQENILHVMIVFGVINDEYNGEEYIETNKGEHYRVIATIIDIVRNFKRNQPNTRIFEFSGIARPDEITERSTLRLKFYSRYLPFIFSDSDWEFVQPNVNTIIVRKKNI